MVTSKPKRISVAAGLVHMMYLLMLGCKQEQTCSCLYDCIMRQQFAFSPTAIHWYGLMIFIRLVESRKLKSKALKSWHDFDHHPIVTKGRTVAFAGK